MSFRVGIDPIEEEPPFVVSEADGTYTAEMIEMQRSRGFGPDETNLIQTSTGTIQA